jgi:hypothetical protein
VRRLVVVEGEQLVLIECATERMQRRGATDYDPARAGGGTLHPTVVTHADRRLHHRRHHRIGADIADQLDMLGAVEEGDILLPGDRPADGNVPQRRLDQSGRGKGCLVAPPLGRLGRRVGGPSPREGETVPELRER